MEAIGSCSSRNFSYNTRPVCSSIKKAAVHQVMAEEGRTITGTKFKSGTENGTENGTEALPEKAVTFLMNYTNKKRKTAEGIMAAIVSDSTITIPFNGVRH